MPDIKSMSTPARKGQSLVRVLCLHALKNKTKNNGVCIWN